VGEWSANGWAYGIWADSRSSVSITNSGTIWADGDGVSVGLLVSGAGVNQVINTGTIKVYGDAWDYAIGIACNGLTTIYNSGTIDTEYDYFGMAVYGEGTTRLILDTGSDLTGYVYLSGDDDTLELRGNGIEDSDFSGVENLVMRDPIRAVALCL